MTEHAGDEILQGLLACERCGHRYPILHGIPVLVHDPAAWLALNPAGPADMSLTPEVAAVLLAPGRDDAPLARWYELLSTHLDAHWGDHATPPVPHAAALYDRIAASAGASRVPLAIELGCGFGRGAYELAAGADLTLGIDLSIETLRRA